MEHFRKNQIKAAFFTEAGSKRGMGHLVRLYTLYEEFISNNIESDFFLDSDIDFSEQFKNIHQFNWASFNIQNDYYDIIFIDSYEANISIYTQISKNCKIAIYLDDYGRLDYPNGVILNFAPDSEKLFFKHKKQIHTYLLGTDYVPIRKDFFNIKPNKKNQIFIMLGGYDTKGLSNNILKALENIKLAKVVVVNTQEKVNSLKGFKNTTILYKPSNVKLLNYMANSMYAISTASMTIYELNYFQIPTTIIAVNKNQQIGATQLIEHKLAINFLDITHNNWQKKLNEYFQNIDAFHQLFQSIDGKGTKRILNSILTMVNDK